MNRDKPSAKGEKRGDPSHPVATGVGAVTGGVAAGAAVGTVAGPVGTAVGAAIGAVAGGLAGKGIADIVDPASEDAYWRENHAGRDYISGGYTYDQDYGPAYRHGVDAYTRYGDRSWDTVENEVAMDWDRGRGSSRLDWDRARPAARDAWDRVHDKVERALPGDADRDGK
jgi:hypothetical protein